MDRTEDGFYDLVGPFLCKREIVREIGMPIWDDQDKRWLVAVEGGRTIGLCAFAPGKGYVRFCSDYVLPESRGRGIYSELFAERLHLNRHATIKATVTEASLGTYVRYDFEVVGKRGRFTLVQRTPKVAA